MKEEIWKDIPGFEGRYQASDLGNIKSLNYLRKRKEQILKPSIKNKYRRVCLSKLGKKKYFDVHQLIAICFLNHKPCGYKLVVDHIDDDPSNNKSKNLQLITNRQNCSKKPRGTSKYIGVHWSKSSNKWVAAIIINGKLKRIGGYKNELDASKAYQNELKKL